MPTIELKELEMQNSWERDYLNQSRNEAHKSQRLVVCDLIRTLLGAPQGKYEIIYSEKNNHPTFRHNHSTYCFSLANKGDYLFFALKEGSDGLGADLETWRVPRDWSVFDHYFFHFSDKQIMKQLMKTYSDENFVSYVLFVAKEACLKSFQLKIDPLDIFFEIREMTNEFIELQYLNCRCRVKWSDQLIYSVCH